MRRKLFVIGTGFDKSHGLDTLYQDFYEYLKSEYSEADEYNIVVPDATIDHHGNEIFDKNEVVGYLLNLINRSEDQYWSSFESTLGKLDFSNEFEELPECYDRDGDRNLFHEAYNNEDLAVKLSKCVPKIKELFSEWIKTIDISKAVPKKEFIEMVDEESDKFLSFNYTLTLEEVYNIKNVCHIHGVIGEELLIGHTSAPLFENGQDGKYIGSEHGLEMIHNILRKDIEGALKKNIDFFEDLGENIHDIYVYGFSCGKEDEEYLRQIIEKTAKSDVTWYFLERENLSKKENILKNLGYKGKVKSYHIKGTD